MLNIHGGASAPGFDHPLELLLACHERIQAQCVTLRNLQNYVLVHGCDAQAQQAAQAILRYFDTAGQHHHQDEEQDLFPRLLECHDVEANTLVQRLLSEHIGMEAAWQRLRPLLVAIARDNATTLEAAAAEDFIRAYDNHIALENSQLLPLAGRLLTPIQLETLGNSMAERRGVMRPTSESTASATNRGV